MPDVPPRLRTSRHLSWFGHMDAVYLFHDLYGYIMQMSPDIATLIDFFSGGGPGSGAGIETAAAIEAYRGDGDPKQFIEVLVGHQVLLDPADDELEGMWAFVPIKGKWNVWQRRGDRLTIWTAWGDKPVQQVFLDPDETRMWDAFDGNKRLVELRGQFDPEKLLGLVRRLVHSDIQALKLSAMPWAAFAKRPAMAPPYLTSTMPYQPWKLGEPVPTKATLVDYHRGSITNADAQFDHLETTLSHLLRVPHPALRGRTYGQALVDVLIERGAIPAGRVRVLEIGAGLGYVARDVINRLRGAGHEVEYTIVELSSVLAVAQRARLGDLASTGVATWITGDILGVKLPDAAFDLILANEMAGDLPAKELHRTDIGLEADGGTVDRDKLRTHGIGAAIAADLNVNLDDAPEPFYLMTGAFELVANIARWLAPGGTTVITEFGDTGSWPKLSTHLDHPELSTHFGQLQQTARASGLDAGTEFVIDLLDFDRDLKGLATTRSHFRALRALAANAGIDLPKLGYTPDLLAATVTDKLDLATVGELRWDKIEDRLMGLVPHEFKALIARRS